MMEPCDACDGTGERDQISGERCYECNGRGWLEYFDQVDEEVGDDFYEESYE